MMLLWAAGVTLGVFIIIVGLVVIGVGLAFDDNPLPGLVVAVIGVIIEISLFSMDVITFNFQGGL